MDQQESQPWLADDEADVLRLFMIGRTDHAIARELGVSVMTVRRRFARVRSRVGARTRVEALALLVHAGQLDPTAGRGDHK